MSLLNSGDVAANYGRIQFNQSLFTTIGVYGNHAFGASDVRFTYGDRVRSHGASFYTTLWFRADQTTAFQSRATFALDGTPGTLGFRFMLQEFHGYESWPYYSTVFEFSGSPQSGSLDLSFAFDGVLKGDQIYALSFSAGGIDSHQVDAEYDFHLTSGPIPEPSSWAGLAALGLLVFGIVRRSRH